MNIKIINMNHGSVVEKDFMEIKTHTNHTLKLI